MLCLLHLGLSLLNETFKLIIPEYKEVGDIVIFFVHISLYTLFLFGPTLPYLHPFSTQVILFYANEALS